MQATELQIPIQAGSFWEATSPIIYSSQIFGILPLRGIHFHPTNTIRFKWLSVQCLICFVFMFWDGVEIVSRFSANKREKINAGIITTMVFYIMGFCIYGAFLHLARNWVEVIKTWTRFEQRFLQAPYMTDESRGLKMRLMVIGLVIAALSVGEHGLFQGSDIYGFYARNSACNITDQGVAIFFIKRFPHIYHIFPYSFALALSQMVSGFATAAWNFLDLFLILISIGITTRFRQLTDTLERHLTVEVASTKDMLTYRMDFITICDLLNYVDNHLGILVFLSSINNLYFICSQLLNVFKYSIEYVYYWYSLLYLIGRTFYMFMMAAAINEAAESPKRLLHNISSKHWNEESSRFLYQINTKTIALSAMGFCNLTRELILTMAGAIVTFELVMMQFYHASEKLPPMCD